MIRKNMRGDKRRLSDFSECVVKDMGLSQQVVPRNTRSFVKCWPTADQPARCGRSVGVSPVRELYYSTVSSRLVRGAPNAHQSNE
jgi:hypothetical protein